jgi:hypothetical protein
MSAAFCVLSWLEVFEFNGALLLLTLLGCLFFHVPVIALGWTLFRRRKAIPTAMTSGVADISLPQD